MKVTKSFDEKVVRSYGFSPSEDGDVKSELENQFNLIEQSIDSNISQRNGVEICRVCGMMIALPKSALKTAEKLCSINGATYPFLYKVSEKDFATEIVSHYLFDGKPIGSENHDEAIKKSKAACQEIGIVPGDNARGEDYLKAWLTYKCNRIIQSFTA